MTRSLTLTAALLSLMATAPALAQNLNISPSQIQPMCKSQAVTFYAQTSQSAVTGWQASTASQHGASWNRWQIAADRSLQQINHSHYGWVWRAQGRPCRTLHSMIAP